MNQIETRYLFIVTRSLKAISHFSGCALLFFPSISIRQFCLILKTTARIPFFGSSCKCEESARTVERNWSRCIRRTSFTR
ncbi:hypothetical protein FIB18_12560 [Brucella pecoris]|uniref:Uncharacterized protein n=1 Tax=Brucella pecoris TaxID=867683 RepID=A0A5C5CJX9_9HYPH|nr:hypothetical protein FIB18_12560 [Brucella pecoris]